MELYIGPQVKRELLNKIYLYIFKFEKERKTPKA